jgi:molybdenum cofactor cytidylyltransferase
MQLLDALNLKQPARLAFVGAGGKTTTMFQLARQLLPPVIVTTTTHLSRQQADLADRFLVVETRLQARKAAGDLAPVTLLAGSSEDPERVGSIPLDVLDELRAIFQEMNLSILVEADGSRERPLKAPAAHEPVIPSWVDTVVVVAGLSGLGKPLSAETVHRPEIFASLSGLSLGEPVTGKGLASVLCASEGGLKGMPAGCHRVALLNQADTPALQSEGFAIARLLLPTFERVLVAGGMNLPQNETRAALDTAEGPVAAAITPVAGIVLAGGQSKRLGQPKQLLSWRGEPFVRQVAKTALQAGLSPVVVVTGAVKEGIEQALEGLPVILAHNPDWEQGQSTSIRAGLRSLPRESGGAIFLLSDQPHTPGMLISTLVETHRRTQAKIIAPEVDGRRANPVLFDRSTFAELLALSGDVGGRAVFSKFRATWVPWHDPSILVDVDSPEDYQKLLDLDRREP